MRRATAALIALALLAVTPQASAYQRPGRLERVVVGPDGARPGPWGAMRPAVTPDGRFVAFESQWSDLAPGDTNEAPDVFVRDRLTGRIDRVSLTSGGGEGERYYWSSLPSISADARFVAFTSTAILVDDLGEHHAQAYVHDRQRRTTEVVSVSSDGVVGNEWSYAEGISADGRYVVLSSWASNLVPNDTNRCSLGATVLSCPDVFVHDRLTGKTERVSVATDGTEANGWSSSASITPDGRFIVFQSEADNLVAGDTNAERDIFVHDRSTGRTELISVSSQGHHGNDRSVRASISDDGRFVAFESGASNLVPRDTNGVQVFVGFPLPPTDIFVRDRQRGTTERVVAADGVEPDDWSIEPVISGNGRYVAFHSMASNLVPGDTNETMDTFVHDRVTGGVDRVSVSESGEEGNHWSASGRPAFARGGREVIFATDAWNLLPETQEGDREVVARDRGPDLGVGAISLGSVDGQVRVGGWASFSGAVLASAADPADDGAGAAPRVGGEITAASAVLRPEAEDLLLRIDVSAIPGARPAAAPAAGGSATGWAGLPAVRYGFEIAAGPVRFEARVLRSTENDVPLGPTFHLYRCEPDCVRVGGLRGSYGNTGDSVRVALPLDRLGLEPGTPLSFRAHTALAESGGDPFLPLDEVTLPAATLAAPSVAVGTAPQGAPYEEVGFSPASLDSGRFTATLAEPEPNHDLWVRACLAETCSWTRREL